MSLYFETIKVVDGEVQLLEYHNKRMNHTRNFFFGCVSPLDLKKVIKIPKEFKNGLVKCKVIYNYEIIEISFENYEIASHNKVKLIEKPKIAYPFKNVDRECFTSLFAEEPEYTDFIILNETHITDSTYSNIVLKKGAIWYTPSTPLFLGVKRQKLLEERKNYSYKNNL